MFQKAIDKAYEFIERSERRHNEIMETLNITYKALELMDDRNRELMIIIKQLKSKLDGDERT